MDAKHKAYYLGLKLKVPHSELKSICKVHQDPQEQLTAIINYFLKQIEPRPTWRLIVEALRSPLVGLPRLAEEVEEAHCPNPTAISDLPPPRTTSGGTDVHYLLKLYSSQSVVQILCLHPHLNPPPPVHNQLQANPALVKFLTLCHRHSILKNTLMSLLKTGTKFCEFWRIHKNR